MTLHVYCGLHCGVCMMMMMMPEMLMMMMMMMPEMMMMMMMIRAVKSGVGGRCVWAGI